MKIHPLTYLYLLFSLMVDKTHIYLLSLFFVVVHELGHYWGARYLQFDIDNITILPFGAFLSLQDFGFHLVKDEIIIVIMGPCISFVCLLIGWLMNNDMVFEINMMILGFNLLPIYPLDGSKLFLLINSYWLDYQKCMIYQIHLSLLSIAICMVCFYDIGYWVVLVYLLMLNYKYCQSYRYLLIQTIVLDQGMQKHIKVHHRLKYLRAYRNLYLYQGQFCSLDKVKIYLIKSIKSS